MLGWRTSAVLHLPVETCHATFWGILVTSQGDLSLQCWELSLASVSPDSSTKIFCESLHLRRKKRRGNFLSSKSAQPSGLRRGEIRRYQHLKILMLLPARKRRTSNADFTDSSCSQSEATSRIDVLVPSMRDSLGKILRTSYSVHDCWKYMIIQF